MRKPSPILNLVAAFAFEAAYVLELVAFGASESSRGFPCLVLIHLPGPDSSSA
jgi:hypothetical protein